MATCTVPSGMDSVAAAARVSMRASVRVLLPRVDGSIVTLKERE